MTQDPAAFTQEKRLRTQRTEGCDSLWDGLYVSENRITISQMSSLYTDWAMPATSFLTSARVTRHVQ